MKHPTGRAVAPSLLCAAAVLLLAACGGDKTPTKPPQCSIVGTAAPAVAAVQPLQPGPYHALFAAAGAEFGVPTALLESIGWTETRWTMVRGHEEFEGVPPAFGIMALRGSALERGAALAGVSAELARTDARANIRAGAALLAAYGRETGADPASSASWSAATGRYSGIEVPEARLQYLARVGAGAGVAGLIPRAYAAAASAVCPPSDTTPSPPTGVADEAGAIWRGSPNFGSRPAPPTGTIHMVIIHTCEGNYSGCWAWLQNPQAVASAHYVVNEDGSEISNLVHERDRAWQIAATYDCTLNYGFECTQGLYNGVSVNHFSIGIEHAGFADTTPWPASMIAASARLVCDMSKRWNIPLDWRHIVGHGQLQPANRHDPGANWPWTLYIGEIQRDCGELVVDDDNARNDTSFVKATTSPAWFTATETTGFFAFGYRWADSGAASDADPLVFSFYLAQPGAKTVEAWWTAGPNRSPQARYVVVSATRDTMGVATVDQRSNGGSWQRLGEWTFPSGWNQVLLSRRGPAGVVVVGDAVRVR